MVISFSYMDAHVQVDLDTFEKEIAERDPDMARLWRAYAEATRRLATEARKKLEVSR